MFAQQSDTDLRQALAVKLEETASWREAKAAQYPADKRNQDAADALNEWAAEIRQNTDLSLKNVPRRPTSLA